MRPEAEPRQTWKILSSLFPPLPKSFGLDALPDALRKVWPLGGKHRRSLGADIYELSRLLTCGRSGLRASYWNRPAYVSAYLYYFLPWNIIRLGRLFQGLRLPDPQNLEKPLLVDVGSGPLSLPLALWLANPAWRSLPVEVLAMDTARQPLQLGAGVFQALAEKIGDPAWKIRIATGPMESAGCQDIRLSQPWLITAANVLNEMKIRRRNGAVAAQDDEDMTTARFGQLLDSWTPLLRDSTAQLLFAEPGTRLGGGLIMRMREAAIELGFTPLSPCTHSGICPLQEKPGSWCHFVFSAQDAPTWLKDITKEAGLCKSSLSLSPLLLARNTAQRATGRLELPARVISRDFAAHGSSSRYGCAPCGLCLLPDSKNLPSGSLTLAHLPRGQHKDRKSGAIMLEPYKSGCSKH